MIDTTEVDEFMNKHRDSCNGSFRTYAWFGMSWEGAKAHTHVQCLDCKEEYKSDKLGSFGSAPEKETKNSQKQDTHEKSISTRKIRNWKVRVG